MQSMQLIQISGNERIVFHNETYGEFQFLIK